MHVKLKEESLQWFSLLTSCWHINEKIHLPGSRDIQKLLQQKRKTCLLRIDHDKKHPLQYLHQPHEKKQRVKPNQLECDRWWQCLPMCGHHQFISQRQFNNMKTIGQGAKGQGFLLRDMKSCIFHNDRENISHNIISFFLHHECNKKDGSP